MRGKRKKSVANGALMAQVSAYFSTEEQKDNQKDFMLNFQQDIAFLIDEIDYHAESSLHRQHPNFTIWENYKFMERPHPKDYRSIL